jgi:hypothetical protein
MTDRSRTPLERLSLASLAPGDLVAPNFALYELTVSDLAARLGIDNRLPDDATLRAAVHLAREVLQPIRDAHGRFAPNSVYRSQALERALKKKRANWVSKSQHTQGCACDVEIPGMKTLELARWARDHLAAFDQIICECYDPRLGPNAGWVHLSLKPPGGGNRRELLSMIRGATGAYVYVDGLTASA